jgi:CheY-like chemotaxis protein
MIAEEDASVRRMLARVLETADYEVVPVGSAGEALSRIQAEPPDLLLLDLNLPDQSSWRVLAASNQGGAHVPVIAMAAGSAQGEQARRKGAQALVEKPLDIARLLALAGRLLSAPPEAVLA